MRAARIVVYAPLRLMHAAERIAKDAAMLAAGGGCSIEVTLVPLPEPGAQAEVVAEGAPECGLPLAEVVQSMLWALEGLGFLPAPVIPAQALRETGVAAP